jgi:GNAT superfamily N-acetyltransferase
VPEIVEFVPDRATPAEWARYHAYRSIVQREHRPDEPLAPDDVTEVRMRFHQHDPFQAHRRYHVVAGDEVIGEMAAEATRPESPEYPTNRHLLWAWIYVPVAHRRHGIGRSLIPTALSQMDAHGATVLTTMAEDEAGFAFLRVAGAEARYTERQSRLDLRRVDWDMVSRWIREGQQASPGARLDLYPQGDPDELLEELCAAATELLNTIPLEGLDHGDVVATPAMARQARERRAAIGTVNPSSVVREADGTISGMTDVVKHAYEPGIVRQEFTGVHERARGRGLGKWLKAAMLEHVRQAYPDTIWITTENAGSNAPMLGINRTLGFEPYREVTYYQVSRETLCRAF